MWYNYNQDIYIMPLIISKQNLLLVFFYLIVAFYLFELIHSSTLCLVSEACNILTASPAEIRLLLKKKKMWGGILV